MHPVGNSSKDSLYAELHEEVFTDMRAQDGVGSSEMEFGTVVRLAQQKTQGGDPVKAAMLAVVLGTIPGNSFADEGASKTVAERAALIGALEALHRVSMQSKSAP